MQQRTGRAASPDQGLIFASFNLRLVIKLGCTTLAHSPGCVASGAMACESSIAATSGGSYRFRNHVTQTLCHFRRRAFRRKHSEPGIDLIVAYAGVRFRAGELTQGRD